MEQVGKPLMPWQREILRDAFGRRADGKWSSFEVGLFVARQNGKGVVIEAIELYALFMLRESQIIHSAELFSTSQKAFRRLQGLIEGSDWCRKRVAKVSEAHGKEGFVLTSKMGGGMLEYKARTLHSARGFSGDRIVLDEAYGLQAGPMAAMTPTLLTFPNAQINYFSSPPDDETGPMPQDAFLPSIRAGGKAGDPQMTYWEWSPRKGAKPADPDTWHECNPSMGYLIDEESMRKQFRIYERASKVDKFSTEMLGAWPDHGDAQWLVITEDQWAAAADPDVAMSDPVAMCIDTAPDRSTSCIAMAGAVGEDVAMEVVDERDGTGWVPARVVELVRRWKPCRLVIDAKGAAGALIPDIEAALKLASLKCEIVDLGFRGVAAAYGMVYDALTGKVAEGDDLVDPDVPRVRRLWHRDDPRLNAAVAGATTRKVGSEGTAWDRRDTAVNISPLAACTGAVWGFVTRPTEVATPWVFAE